MKLSKIQQIIKEEVAKAISEMEDKNRELNDKFAAAVGFQKPAPGGPENKMRTKKYAFEYDYFDKRGEMDTDEVVVDASSEEEARELAYKKARQTHTQVRTKKENFRLIS